MFKNPINRYKVASNAVLGPFHQPINLRLLKRLGLLLWLTITNLVLFHYFETPALKASSSKIAYELNNIAFGGWQIAQEELKKSNIEPLKSFLASIEGMIRMRALEKDLSFQLQTCNSLPTGIVGDEKRLRQILLNLMGNAIKFTARIRSRPRQVSFINSYSSY